MKKIKTINISYELDTEDVPTVIISEVVERTNGYGQKESYTEVIHTAQGINGVCAISVN